MCLAANGTEGLRLAAREHPDVVILDLGLPDMDGVEVATALRGWSTVPIVVLSARDAEAVKVAALDAGADDYVTKPFGMNEFLARLRAALRRAAPTDEEPTVTTPDFTIDLGGQARAHGRRRRAPHADGVADRRSARAEPRASSSRSNSCCSRCGDRSTSARRTTCAST